MPNRHLRAPSLTAAKKLTATFLFTLLALAMMALATNARAQATGLEVLLQFSAFIDGANPQGALVQGTDGNFYGTTSGGGTNGDYGTVYSITPGGVRTILHSFSASPTEGQFPYAGLTLGPDGNFYGTTESGGPSNDGTVFQITPAGVLTTLHSFSGGDGQFPYAGLVLNTDGRFYGTTIAGGGGAGQGTVYAITPAGVLTTLHSFTGGDGSAPYAAVVRGQDGNFYGTTFTGGTNGLGTIYVITPAGVLTTLYTFAGSSDGEFPYAGLILGHDNNFYGITSSQSSVAGTAYVITPAGVLTTLHTFAGSDGSGLQSALVQGTDGNFYGTTSTGAGGTGDGTVFQLTPTGTLTTLHTFTGLDGSSPQSALVQGTDGNFYGITRFGGIDDDGTAYIITPAGTLTSLHSFGYANTTGAFPRAGLIQGNNGNFYFTTSYGGANGYGTISMLTPAGALTTLYSFTSVDSGGANADGALSRATLVQGTDGTLYGTTLGGGTGAKGAIFKLASDGTLTTLHSFAGYPTDGDSPEAGLLMGIDGNFYGTTTSGGTFSAGTVFRVTPAGALMILHSFTGSDGANPDSALILGADGKFYGTTSSGGAQNDGTVFSMTATGALSTLHSFSGVDGSAPPAALIEVNDVFYGTTSSGGAQNDGTVFSMTPTGTLTTLHSFTGADGSAPQAALILGIDENFYGTASAGGANGLGSAFTMTPTGTLTTLHSFTGADGSSPQAALIQTTDGNLYSTTENGGTNGTGTVFVLTSAPTITSALTANVQVNTAFTYQIAGSNSPTSFNAVDLPAGLTVDPATGLITGTPTVAGTYPVTISATNAVGTGTATLNLTVTTTAIAPPVISSSAMATAQVGVMFTYQIAATNDPTSFGATGLPNGLSVDPATGIISGVVDTAGTYTPTISATNSGGPGTATLTITVTATTVQPPVITSAASASEQSGVAFSYQITATNTPTSFAATGLPTGLTANRTTGLISGTSTAVGNYSVALSATNVGGIGTASLTLIVSSTPVVVPVIGSSSSITGLIGQPFDYQIVASNFPTSFGASGLPAGLSVDPTTGLISGTPTAVAATYPVTISATNASGTGTATLTLILTTNAAQVLPMVTAIRLGDGTATEGSTVGKVKIVRTGDTSAPLTVRYKVKGGAVAGVDYKPLSGTVTILAGATFAKIKIKPIDNDTVDGTRIAKVKLLPSLDSTYTIGSPAVGKILILDND